jgi:hypothetical protein
MSSHFGLSLNAYNAVVTINPKLNKGNKLCWTLSLVSKSGNKCYTTSNYTYINLNRTSSSSSSSSSSSFLDGYNSMLPIHPPNPETEVKASKTVVVDNYMAMLTIDSVLVENNKISWSLKMSDKKQTNSTSTYGYLTVVPTATAPDSTPITPITAVTPPAVSVSSEPIAPASESAFLQSNDVKEYVDKRLNEISFDADEKMKHVAHIRKLLDNVEQAKGKENKAVIATEILTYITDSALEFTKFYPKFKATVINKCYEFKTQHSDISELIEKTDNLLLKLGVSTTVPSDYVPPVYPTTTTATAATNTVVNASEKPADKPSAEVKSYNPEMELFISAAKIHDDKNAIKNPENWYKWYQHCLKIRSVKGSTPAEKMYHFFNVRSDTNARINLMKSLFTKNNLVFSEAVMPLYSEWVKTFTYTGDGKVNRYIKMNEFIKTYKSLFTPIAN